jgi:hypothetical protein
MIHRSENGFTQSHHRRKLTSLNSCANRQVFPSPPYQLHGLPPRRIRCTILFGGALICTELPIISVLPSPRLLLLILGVRELVSFHVMASLAQIERELIMEHTRAGLQAARRQGGVSGRKRQTTDNKIQAVRRLLASGTPSHEVAQSLGVSVATLYRWVPASSRMEENWR